MTQDEKLIWASVYATTQVALGGDDIYTSQLDVRRAVDAADHTIITMRKYAKRNGALHSDKDLAAETRYTTPVEGIEL